jgi:hypothetical protein
MTVAHISEVTACNVKKELESRWGTKGTDVSYDDCLTPLSTIFQLYQEQKEGNQQYLNNEQKYGVRKKCCHC